MHLTCDHAALLIPSYVDAELSEAQAQPLRAHLLSCPACREIAKDGRALKRWFVPPPAEAVPEGFAARVARRAFAGDTGGPEVSPAARKAEAEAPIQAFLLRATAAAAALLLGLAGLLQLQARPATGGEIRAEDLEQVWEEIYGLEPARPASAAPATAPPASGEAPGLPAGPRLR